MGKCLWFAFFLSITISTVNAQGVFYTECDSIKQHGATVKLVANNNVTFVQSFTAGSTPPFLLTYDHDSATGANIKTCRYSVTAAGPCNVIGGDCTSCTYITATNTLNVTFVLGNLTDSMDQSTIRYTLPASGISDVELARISVTAGCNTETMINNATAISNSTCGNDCSRNFTCNQYMDISANFKCMCDASWEGDITCDEVTCDESSIQSSCGGNGSCCYSMMSSNFTLPYLGMMNVSCCAGYDSGFGFVTCIGQDMVNSTLYCNNITTTTAPPNTTMQSTTFTTSGHTVTSTNSTSSVGNPVTCNFMTCVGCCNASDLENLSSTILDHGQSLNVTCCDNAFMNETGFICTDGIIPNLECDKSTTTSMSSVPSTANVTSTKIGSTTVSSSSSEDPTSITIDGTPTPVPSVATTGTCNIANICGGCCDLSGTINFGETVSVGCCNGSTSSSPSIQGECAVNGFVDAEKIKICCKGSELSNGETAGIVIAVIGVVIIIVIIVLLFCKFEGKWPNKWKMATLVMFSLGIIFWLMGFVLCFATGDDCLYPEMTGGQIAGTVVGSVGLILLIIAMGCFICFRAKGSKSSVAPT